MRTPPPDSMVSEDNASHVVDIDTLHQVKRLEVESNRLIVSRSQHLAVVDHADIWLDCVGDDVVEVGVLGASAHFESAVVIQHTVPGTRRWWWAQDTTDLDTYPSTSSLLTNFINFLRNSESHGSSIASES